MKTYTLPELREAWSSYEKAQVLRVLVGGKWETRPLNTGHTNIEATQAMVKDICAIMDFPDYLEKLWKK